MNPTLSAGALPRLSLSFYFTVALVAGAVIAYQIAIMRIFSVASWAHFGSFVVGLAMFGFGLVSAIMCIGKAHFERHWDRWITVALVLFGPLMVAANCVAQALPFNPIFLVSDPTQKWRLAGNFLIYFIPFLPGAFFLGLVFLRGQHVFGKVYFADLGGSGLCGLVFLLAMYFVLPQHLILVPLAMWLVGALIWFLAAGQRRAALLSHRAGDRRNGGDLHAAADHGVVLQGRFLCPQLPRFAAHLSRHLAARADGNLRQLLFPFRPRLDRHGGAQSR